MTRRVDLVISVPTAPKKVNLQGKTVLRLRMPFAVKSKI